MICFRYHYISLPFTEFVLVSSSAQRVEDQRLECVEVKTFSFVNLGAFPKGKQTVTLTISQTYTCWPCNSRWQILIIYANLLVQWWVLNRSTALSFVVLDAHTRLLDVVNAQILSQLRSNPSSLVKCTV